jgi:lincosamide nucleotidyltransferase A/C/D/E
VEGSGVAEMTSAVLLDILALLERENLEVWLDGGWGIDALVGEQTRPHKDVDLIPRLADVPRLMRVLAGRGFELRNGTPPHGFVLTNPDGLAVDVHSVEFDAEGRGLYRMENGEIWIYPADGFSGRGTIAGRAVWCLSAEAQVLCHAQGYEPTDKDRSDMAHLAAKFGVELPEHLKG